MTLMHFTTVVGTAVLLSAVSSIAGLADGWALIVGVGAMAVLMLASR